MLNLTVPNFTVTVSPLDCDGNPIATLDVSSAIVSIEIDHEQQTNLSGLLPWSARIELNRKRVIPGVSFNPRDMLATPKGAQIWAKGTKVDIYIADFSGTLRRFWPSFYILSQPAGNPVMTCELVDEIGLKSYQQAEGDESGVELGTATSRTQVVRNILRSFSARPISGSISGVLSAPIQKVTVQSFAQQAGELAWTSPNPCLIWMDKNNTIELDQFNFYPTVAAFTLTEDENCSELEDLDADERPNIIRVIGTAQQVTELDNPNCTILETTDGNDVTLREEVCTRIDEISRVWTDTTRYLQEQEINPDSTSTNLRLAEEIQQIDYYSIGSVERLYRTTREERRARGLINIFNTPYSRTLAVDETINYDYGDDEVIRRRTRRKRMATSLLNPSNPIDTLRDAEEEIETWKRLSRDRWEYQRILKRARILVDPDTPSNNPYQLVTVESENVKGSDANPPATQFLPSTIVTEEKQVEGEATFQSLSGCFLDQVKVITLPGQCGVDDATCAQLAAKYGKLIYGRSLGVVCETQILDWLLTSYQPYARWDLVDIDGIKTAYWLDGVSIRIEGNRRAFVEIAGAEIGIVT